MGFNTVYRSLLEIFPQIDGRILRAVAIEHPKDADVAVGVVLSEIVPSLPENFAPHVSGSKSSTSSGTVSLAVGHGNDATTVSVVSTEMVSHLDETSDMPPNGGGDAFHGYTDCTKFASQRQATEKDGLVTENTRLDTDNLQDFGGGLADNRNTVDNGRCNQAESSLSEGLENAAPWMLDLNSGKLVADNQVEPGSGSSNNVYERLRDSETSDTGEADEVDGAFSTIVTRSAQVCSVDLLDEIIEDAKSNKKTLFAVMDSVMNLMKEVELQEKAAKEAKDEAARGGWDTLRKVEELKEMLEHAKEANDMHAGEVYGEKSILTTEVKELESRLLNLSAERDESLATLDEMLEMLETRLAAAQEMKQAAEQEKQEKEDSARKAFAEQEAIMDKVVQESKLLQQEAEENSKLREFLMDRGRIVDSLQGEISVICQDVQQLKEKFDKRVPLSQSISSSQTSCRLASSGSSLKNLVLDKYTDRTFEMSTVSNNSNKRSTGDENGDGEERLEDGWDICDKETEV